VGTNHDRTLGDRTLLAGALLVAGSFLLFVFSTRLGYDEGSLLRRQTNLNQSLGLLRDIRSALDRVQGDLASSGSTHTVFRDVAKLRNLLSSLFRKSMSFKGMEPEEQAYFQSLARGIDTGTLRMEPSVYREGDRILGHSERLLARRLRDDRQSYGWTEDLRLGTEALAFMLAAGGILGMAFSARRIKKNAARVTDLLDASGLPVFLKDRKGRWIWANRSGVRLFGLDRKPPSVWRDRDFSAASGLRAGEYLERFQKNDAEALKRGDLTRTVEVVSRQGGSPRHMDFVRIPLWDEDGVPLGLLVTGQEISVQILKNLHLALSRINELITRIPDPETLFDEVCRIVMEYGRVRECLIGELDPETRNLSWIELRGITAEAAEALRFSSDPALPEGMGLVGSVLRSGRPRTARLHKDEYPILRKPDEESPDGIHDVGVFPFFRGNRIFGALLVHDPSTGGFDPEMTDFLVQISRNLSFALDNWDREHHKKSEEDKIVFMAFHDPLTSLPNRRLFMDRINQARERSLRGMEHFAVGVLDLDGFKAVNDRWGHQMGDKLLVEVSGRLKRTLRGADTLARLGGDEFGFVFADLAATSLDQITRRIIDIFSQPFEIGDRSIVIGGSLGVTLCPPDEGDANTLIAHADKAMYQVKATTKNSWKVFAPL
jgi:diguanylate cyclase (GGDEF)-like protein